MEDLHIVNIHFFIENTKDNKDLIKKDYSRY